MDINSLLHAYNKIMADRATSNTTVRSDNNTGTTSPPPAYTTTNNPTTHQPAAAITALPHLDDLDHLYGSDIDDSDEATPPTLALDAATTIRGSHNILAVPPIDGPRLTTVLLSILHGNGTLPPASPVRQQQAVAPQSAGTPAPSTQQQQPSLHPLLTDVHGDRRPLSIRIDCGVRIVGDRNVLGGVPQQQRASVSGSAAVGARVAGSQSSGGRLSPTTTTTPPLTPVAEGHGGDGDGGARKRKAEEEGGRVELKREKGGDGNVEK